ncbi:hypothetical protein J6590_038653 [Homalodisca vitripennis]|nr:hypothetical protein J6590_038653 [Homalodisca vitripennis]
MKQKTLIPENLGTFNNFIVELENSLIESNLLEDSSNDDHKLQMAAKIGSALLEENNVLKEAKFKLETRLLIMESKLGEMETNERKYIDKVELLQQQTAELQDRLEEEKKLRQETQAISEEQDFELCQLINNQSKTMDEQKNTILTLQKKIISQGAINKTYQNSYTQTNTPVSDNTKYSVSSARLLIDLEEIKTKLNQMEAMLRFLKTDLSQENKSSTAMQNSQSLKKIRYTDRKTNVYSVSLQAAKYTLVYQKEVTVTPESILFMTPKTTSAEETDSETHIPTAAETPVITAAEKTMNITTNSSEKTSVKTTWNTLTETNMATAAEKITTAGSKTSPTTAADKTMNITTNSSEKTSVKTTWNTLTETNMATAAEKITTAGSKTSPTTAADKTMNITTNSSEKTSVKTTWNTLTETNMAAAAEKITTAGSKTSPTTAAEKRMSTVAETNLNCSSPFQSSQVSPSGEKKPPHTSTKLKVGETYQDFFNKNIDKARKLRNEILTASKQTITPVTKPVHQTPNRTTTKLTKKPFLALRQWKEYRYKTRKFHNSDHRRKYNGEIAKAI